MPQKASTLWNVFPNSFVISVEQLQLVVPAEVQLPPECWQAGGVQLCKVSSGDQVAKQECAFRDCLPLPIHDK